MEQNPFDEDLERFHPEKIDAIVNPDGHTLYVLFFDAEQDIDKLNRQIPLYAKSVEKSKVLKTGDSVIVLPNTMSLATVSVDQLRSWNNEVAELIEKIESGKCKYYHDGECWGTREREKFECKGEEELCPQNFQNS